MGDNISSPRNKSTCNILYVNMSPLVKVSSWSAAVSWKPVTIDNWVYVYMTSD